MIDGLSVSGSILQYTFYFKLKSRDVESIHVHARMYAKAILFILS